MTNYLQTRKLRLRKIKLLRKIKVIRSDGGELKFEAGGSDFGQSPLSPPSDTAPGYLVPGQVTLFTHFPLLSESSQLLQSSD